MNLFYCERSILFSPLYSFYFFASTSRTISRIDCEDWPSSMRCSVNAEVFAFTTSRSVRSAPTRMVPPAFGVRMRDSFPA